jgi:hypothetical protein
MVTRDGDGWMGMAGVTLDGKVQRNFRGESLAALQQLVCHPINQSTNQSILLID